MIEPEKKKKTPTLFPERLFYKIGETSRITGVESYVLRYWETEFPFLRPRKNSSGQRLYTKKDIDLILEIKRLLYDEKYTIEGVRKKLSKGLKVINTSAQQANRERLERVKKKLREIIDSL